jgi:hypothetical protein
MKTDKHLDHNLLNEYLDGELPPQKQTVVQSHLASCAGCAAELAALQTLFATLEQLPDLEPEHELAPAIMQAISLPPQRAALPKMPLALRLVFALQALLALFLLGFAYRVYAAAIPSNSFLQTSLEYWSAATDAILLRFSTLWSNWLIEIAQTGQALVSQTLAAWELLAAPPVLLQLPALQLAGLVFLSFMLWLAANSLLLGLRNPGGSAFSRRTPAPSKRRN